MKRLLIAVSIAFAANAQLKQSIDVTLIEVPVVVSSASGDPVRGLTKENFTILDNGKPRKVSSFEVVDFGPAGENRSALTPVNPVARRSFLILFDLSNATPNSLVRAQEAARKFVETNLEPRDVVAVATLDVERGYNLLTAFTTDRELTSSAIDSPTTFRSRDPFGLANSTRAFSAMVEAPGMANLASDRLSGIDLARDMDRSFAPLAIRQELAMARDMAHANEKQVRHRVERQMISFSQIADSLAGAPGRKQIVLLSEGVPAKILTGRDARDGQAAAEQAERIIRGTWLTREARTEDSDQDERYGATDTLSLMKAMTEFFKKSDVVMHALDVQGIRVQGSTFEGSTINSNNGLATIARATGGQMFANSNDVGENFRRLLHRQEVVYILGFYAPSEKTGTFHELKVKVTGAPRRSEVASRAGYYEGGGLAGQRALTDAEVIINDSAEKGIRVAGFAAAFPSTDGFAQVPVVAEISGEDLADATLLMSEATIAVFAFDEQGTVRDRIIDTLSFDRSASAERLREQGVKYYATLRLPPGKYAVKTLLRVAKGGRRGYSRVDITVPKSGEFAVVPFVIDEHPARWVMVKGTSHDVATDVYPFQINGQPLMPAVLPRLAAGDARRVALFVQNAEAGALNVDATPKVSIVETAKVGELTKLILQLAPISSENAVNVVVRKGESEALRARLPVVIQ